MSSRTPNYNLIKPDITEKALIGDINNNMDTIDNVLAAKLDKPTAVPAGKFLQTDSNGDAVWGNAASPTDVTNAVTDWLDDNIPTGQTVAVDQSLTVSGAAADAKKTGDKITNLNRAVKDTETAMETGYMPWGKDLWVIGGLKSTGEIDTNSRVRITTSSLQHTDRELEIHANSGYRFAIAYYTSADVFDSIVWWPDNYTIPRGSYYRITIAKSPDSVVNVTVNELYREVTYKSGLKAEIDDLRFEYAKTENNAFIGINNKKISKIGKINVDGATTVYMCGENFIPMEYSDASVHERNGLTFEINSDGSVHVSGTATSQTEYRLRARNTGWKIPAGDYTVVGSIDRNIVVALGAFTGSTWVKNLSSTDLYESNTVVDYDGYDNLQIGIVIKNAATVDAIVYPQLLYGANIPVSRYIAPQSYKQYTVSGEAIIEAAVEYNDGFNVYNFNGVNMSVEYQYLEEPKYNKYLISVISQKNISSHKFAVSNDGTKWSEIGFSIPFDGFQAETQIVHINDTYYFTATANNGQPGDGGDALVAYTQDFINWKMQLVDFDLYDIQIAAGVAPEYCRRWTPSIIDAHGEYYLTVSCATGPDGTYSSSDWSPGETYKTMQPKIIKIKFNSDRSIEKDGEWVDFNLNQSFEAIIDLTVKWAHNLKKYICTFVDNKERVSCVAIARNMGEQFAVQATNIFDMRDVESPTFIEAGDEIVYYGSHYWFGETGYIIARTTNNLKFKNEVPDISTTYDQFLLRTLYPFVVDTALMDNFFSQYVLYLGEYFEERINYKKLDVRITTDRTPSFSSQPGCNYYIQDSGEYDISSFAVKNQYATKQIMIVPKTTCTITLGDQSKVITENDIGKPVFVYFASQTNAILS